MRRVVLRSLVLIAVILSLSIPAAPVSAGPPIDLAGLRIEYDWMPPISGHGYRVDGIPRGEWRVVGSRFEGRRLTLDLEIRPQAISVPLEPGPAVLFGRLSLGGGDGGDVGAEADVPLLTARVMPTCTDPVDCVYRGSITLPTDRLPRLAARYPTASWGSAVIGLTLVRTYAQGTWLQVLPLYDEGRDEPDGTVSDPLPISRGMQVYGAFPVGDRALWSHRELAVLDRIERLRRSVDDPSGLPETQPLLVGIETAPCTPGWTIATATGDVLVDVAEPGPSVPLRVEAPVGAEWTVSVPSLDRAQGVGSARTFGPFGSDVPGLVSGWVSGDDYLCEGLEPGSVAWRPASADEVATFPESDPTDVFDTYTTLPRVLAWQEGGRWSVQRPTSAFERLWQPFEAADIPFRYRCATEDSFTTMDLADATPTDEASDPLAEAIGHWGGWLGGAMDWHVVSQVDDRVLALSPALGGGFPVDELELTRTITDGPGYETWDFAGGGDCRPEAVLGSGIAGQWRVDPRFPAPGPKTRTLHVLGYVGCNGTEKTGPARFHATDEAMLIAIPMASTFNSDACSGLGPTRMTVALPEPLGQRDLYDAGSLPLRRIGPKTGLGIR